MMKNRLINIWILLLGILILNSCGENSNSECEKGLFFSTNKFRNTIKNELNYDLDRITRVLDSAASSEENFYENFAHRVAINDPNGSWESVNLGVQINDDNGELFDVKDGDSLSLILSKSLYESINEGTICSKKLRRYKIYIKELNPNNGTILYQDFFDAIDIIKNEISEDELKYLIAFSLLYVSLEQMEERAILR